MTNFGSNNPGLPQFLPIDEKAIEEARLICESMTDAERMEAALRYIQLTYANATSIHYHVGTRRINVEEEAEGEATAHPGLSPRLGSGSADDGRSASRDIR